MMKPERILLGALLVGASVPALADVSISVGKPGYYGQIDIGDYPRPVLINPQPVIIQQGVSRAPLYLHVPPEYARNWREHCDEFNACGAPVYFVEDRWYNEVYVPGFRLRHRDKD